MRSIVYLLVSIASLTLAACGESGSHSEPAPAVDLSTLPGVYAGVFPCQNCPGIDARLWLRPDGAFFMRQDHRAAEGVDVERTHAFGRWAWDAGGGELVLRGRGPERRFHYAERALRMLVPGVPHVLERDEAPLPFTDRVTFEGQYESSAGSGTVTECATGLRFAVRDDASGRNLRRRHRGISPANHAVWVSIEAHLVFGPAEILAVDRVLAMRPSHDC
jgi:copper homeostasis protein (lipoprotein)